VLCYGNTTGSIDLTVSGGTSPYAYSWNTAPAQTTQDLSNLSAGTYTVTVTDQSNCTKTATAVITEPTAPLSASTTQTNVLCNGNTTGSIDLTVTGGTSPYTYSWNTTPVQTTQDLSNLGAGSYTVNITDDNGCSTTASVTITEPIQSLSASTTQTNVLCYGNTTGSIDLTVSGGTSPYTYSWNTTPAQTTQDLSNLSAGTYTVTITDDNGCSTTSSVTLSQPASGMTASTTQTDVLCNGDATGSIDLTVIGGTGTYTYSWNTTPVQTTEDLTNLQAGTYTVTVTDQSNCTTTATAVITEPTAPLSASTTQTNVLCNGNTTGSIDLTVTGGTSPYTYSWNTTPVQTTQDLSNLGAGSYTVNITDDNGCSTNASVTITEPTVLSATLDGQINVTCFGGNNGSVLITTSGGVGPYSISPAQNNLIAGPYTFIVTDNNGCQFPVNAQITEPQADLTVSISSQTNVSCNGLSDGSVVLAISGGTAPYSSSPSTTNLSPGTYTYTVTDNNGCAASVLITITEPLILDAQASSTIITTSGGTSTVTITATGGSTPYTGAGTFIVTAGTYSYTVTDVNGCSDVVTLTITEPLPLTASSTATSILCNGGTAQITVNGNGGTAPYTGTGSFTVTAGTYTYTITDFYGNTANTTIIVTEPTPLASSSNATPILCYGDLSTVNVSASGGVSPYTGIGSFNETAGSYTYNITDNNGCPTQTSINISQPSQVIANASVVDVLCNNGFGSIDLTVSGGVGPYNVLWNNTINSEDLTNIIAGTYTAVVTDQNNCQSTFTYSVANTFAPTPILTNNVGTTILTCAVTSIDYTVSNVLTSSWNGGQTPTSLTNTFSSLGQYILNVTDSNSCPVQFVINITENITPPNAGINTTPNSTILTCANPTITAQATGGGTYLWSNGLGTNANQSLTQVGIYTVTVTGSNGCSSLASITLTSNQTAPTAVITNNTGSTNLHCNQTQINVTASGGVTYQWSNGLGSIPTVNLTSAGTYTVTATAANGCTDTETITINQIANPTVTVSSITICSGSSGTLTAVPSTPGGSYVWTQLPSNNVLPGTSASVSVNPTSNAIYNVQYFDVNNCPSNTAMANVVVTPTPVVNVSGTTTICSGNNAVITANSSLTGAGGTYTWSPNSASTQSVTVAPTLSTTYSVYYTLNGCPSNTANHLVTVYQTPTVSVNNIGICTGSQGTLTATPSELGGTYSWNTTPNISTTQSITLQPLNTVSYTVVYTSTNNCPSQPATGTITVTDVPSVQLDDIFVCEGQSGSLTAIPSVPGGVFIWTPSVGTSGSSYTITPTASTSVSVIYSLNDCPSPSVSAQVTLVNTPSVTVNNIGICQNQFGTLTANPSAPGGTYLWSTNETSQTISVNPQSDSTYSVIYFLNGCPSPQASATVTVDPIPVVTFDVDYTEGCLPLTVNLTNTTPNTQNCTWNLGNGATLNECDNLSYTFQNPGCFDISLTTDSPNGCSNTLTLTDLICAYPTPVADFSLSTTEIVEGDNTIYIQNTSSGGIEYIWNYGDETGDTLYNPESHTYAGTLQESYLITLIAISNQGCIDSTSQLIRVSDDLVFFAPNTFIPNEDGLNDIWIPVFSSGFNIENYELNIYNRWGQLVFITEDYLQGWDGKFNDAIVQDGVYTFKITFRNAKDKINQIHTGHINLVR
jgi:gliding motility-associated-like protein